jgi:carbon-monoxide dehydrogenase large subunit
MSTDRCIAARFGSGQAVRRIEDPALVQGQGRFTDDVRPRASCTWSSCAAAWRMAASSASTSTAARALPGVVAVYTGADLVAAGVKPMPTAPPFPRPDGKPMAAPPKRAAGARPGALTSASRWPRSWPIARGRARRADAVLVDYEDLPVNVDPLRACSPARRCCGTARPTTSAPRCATATPPRPRRSRAGGARGVAGPRQPAPGAGPMEPRSVLAGRPTPTAA